MISNLTSLYFQSSQSLPNSIQLILRKPHQRALYLNEQMTRTPFPLLQPPIRSFPAQVILQLKGHQNLHLMSHCTPVCIPAKIIWKNQNLKTEYVITRGQLLSAQRI